LDTASRHIRGVAHKLQTTPLCLTEGQQQWGLGSAHSLTMMQVVSDISLQLQYFSSNRDVSLQLQYFSSNQQGDLPLDASQHVHSALSVW